jgi:hypothetical protein
MPAFLWLVLSPPCTKILAAARKPGKAGLWCEWVPSDPNDDYSEFGDDAPLMCAVARIAAAVLRPPKV